MVASDTALQDQNTGHRSGTIGPTSNPISKDALKEHFLLGGDHALKVRKPYTIMKQRERWTEEEHKKFVEALKLYGRAWRRIEEHVGTKTAVQIRSHAQKFFSKVARESNSDEASSIKPTEIPPPRPKRKPMHPYPRKLASPVKSRNAAAEDLTVLEQQNQSPTSVLSAVVSDVLCTSESNTPNGAQSPTSSSACVNPQANLLSVENRCAYDQPNGSSNMDEEAAVNLQLLSQGDGLTEEGTAATSTRCLKLFGKTVVVNDCHKSSSTQDSCKALSFDAAGVQTFSWNMMPTKFSSVDSACPLSLSAYPCDGSRTLYFMPLQNECQSSMKSGATPPLPWGMSCGDATSSSPRVYSPIPVKACPLSDHKGKHEKDAQTEGSSSGSNTESVSLEGDEDRRSDVEAQSLRLPFVKSEKVERSAPSRSAKAGFLKHRPIPVNCNKGFMPYKRCLAERDPQSATIANKRGASNESVFACS